MGTKIAELGYRRVLRRMWVCVRCAALHERGKPYESSQLCACRRTRPQKKWDGFDFNERARLCECCCASVVASGSRWSVWFCSDCRAYIDPWNETADRPLPTGRHTLMSRRGLEAGRPLPDEGIHSWAERLKEAFDDISSGYTILKAHRERYLRRVLWKLDLPARDLRLVTYLERVAEGGRDRIVRRGFKELVGSP